jgi:hypothetical protein
MKADTEKKIEKELIIKTDKIKNSPYIKKGNEQPVEGEMPTGFAITLFNIIFMYPTNITVISKLTNQIVYFDNFKEGKILRGICLDVTKNQLLAYGPKDTIQIANLLGEDKDAWRYYLKKGKIKEAISACSNSKQKAQVHSEEADKRFQSGRYA